MHACKDVNMTITTESVTVVDMDDCNVCDSHTTQHAAFIIIIIIMFFPVAVETLGALADDGHRFIRDIGRRAALSTADPRETTFLYQCFWIAI